MNSKHEAIKAAYGEFFTEENIDENGWTNNPPDGMLKSIACEAKEMHITFGSPEMWYRPKSLTGIENNRGWTRVEDETPEISGEYWATNGYGQIRRLYFSKWEDEWQEITNNSISHTVSHWQNIEEPKPKVY